MTIALSREDVETPIGAFSLVVDGEGRLRAAEFADCEERLLLMLRRRLGPAAGALSPGPAPAGIRTALAAYFEGDIAAIRRIPLRLDGTPFQDAVWTALQAVEPGRPIPYSVLAQRIGRPQAIRAVGHANGANPLSIVVPCHRLVGADGALTGYGGGIARKRWLLDHEARHAER